MVAVPTSMPRWSMVGHASVEEATYMTTRKGSPGSGNIVRRPSGAWMIRVSAGVDPVTGRRRQVTKTIRGTRRDAQAILAKLLAETASVGAASQVTVADLIVEYLRGADLSPTTRDD